MKHKNLFLLLLISCSVLISGCWDKNELTDLALVIAMGIDKTENGEYVVSFQVVNPRNVVGSTQSNGNDQGIPVVVYKVKGRDLLSTIRMGTKSVSRKLYFAHTNLIVIGEKLARDGMYGIFDMLERDQEFRNTAGVVIAKDGTAEQLISTLTPLEKIPANKLLKSIQFTEELLGENMDVTVTDLINGFVSDGKEPVINGYKVNGDKRKGKLAANIQSTIPESLIVADGIAFIKDGKLLTWATGENAKTVVALKNKIKSTFIPLKWNGKKNGIVYVVTNQKSKIAMNSDNGNPIITINIKNEGYIDEANIPIDLTNPKIINELNRSLEREIKSNLMDGIRMAQTEKVDVFGFGEVIHRKDPVMWEKLKNDWNDVGFKNLQVKINADVFIRRSELRNKPFLSNMKQ